MTCYQSQKACVLSDALKRMAWGRGTDWQPEGLASGAWEKACTQKLPALLAKRENILHVVAVCGSSLNMQKFCREGSLALYVVVCNFSSTLNQHAWPLSLSPTAPNPPSHCFHVAPHACLPCICISFSVVGCSQDGTLLQTVCNLPESKLEKENTKKGEEYFEIIEKASKSNNTTELPRIVDFERRRRKRTPGCFSCLAHSKNRVLQGI